MNYLEVCCLNRPFDDQSQARIRLEAEAVILILAECDTGRWKHMASDISRLEISAISDSKLRRALLRLLPSPESIIQMDQGIEERAKTLIKLGFKPADALHVSSAELGADVFLSCDDRLLGIAKRVKKSLRVAVANPLAWVEAENLK